MGQRHRGKTERKLLLKGLLRASICIHGSQNSVVHYCGPSSHCPRDGVDCPQVTGRKLKVRGGEAACSPKVTGTLSGRASIHPHLLTLCQHPSPFSHVSLSGDGPFIFLKHHLHQSISSSPSKKRKKSPVTPPIPRSSTNFSAQHFQASLTH